MSIDEFISTVAPKLKSRVKSADKGMYVVERIDHRTKLRLAWLSGKQAGVRTYLEKFLKAKDLEEVTKVIWNLK